MALIYPKSIIGNGITKLNNPKTVAILTFMRHGHKDDVGSLTHIGHQQAKNRGIHTNNLGDNIILFHSGVERVRNTVRTMAAHLHLSTEQTETYELDEHILDYVVPSLHYLINPHAKSTYFSNWDKIDHTPENIEKRIEYFLSNEKSTEPNEHYGPLDMAKNIAKIIDTEIRFATLTDVNHRVNFVNGSHEPVLTSFIYYFLNDYKSNGPNTISDIGGTVDFAESFDIIVNHIINNDYEIELQFRNYTKKLDLESLRRFITID